MKPILITLFFIISHCTFAQTDSLSSHESVLQTQNFKIYQTTNFWNLLKLDTRNGKVWQVQFAMEPKERGTFIINDQPLIISTEKEVAGRFELYPTKNNYTFILLDKLSGRTFQVQWSLESNERFLEFIR